MSSGGNVLTTLFTRHCYLWKVKVKNYDAKAENGKSECGNLKTATRCQVVAMSWQLLSPSHRHCYVWKVKVKNYEVKGENVTNE